MTIVLGLVSRLIPILLAAYVGLILLASAAGAQNVAPPALSEEGPGILIVDGRRPRERLSEAYDDSAAYLLSFQQRAGASVAIRKIRPADYRKAFAAPKLSGSAATLFIAADGRVLIHPGLILEPRIYELGDAFLKQGTVTEEAAQYGLAPATLLPRRRSGSHPSPASSSSR